MPEPGGPTTQSGIFYQNSVAALYLGRLCDATPRPDTDRVIEVRVEAPEAVDDTVVTFTDNHRTYIQAKENIRTSEEAWRNLWQHFSNQFLNPNFRQGYDRLLLHIGESHTNHHALQAACERAKTSANDIEWWERLTQVQQGLVEKIKQLLSLELQIPTNLLAFFRHVDVEIWTLRQIERDFMPLWMPLSTHPPQTLFRLLRDRVGGQARHRGSFVAQTLRNDLTLTDGVQFTQPLPIDELRDIVTACGSVLRQHKSTMGATDKHIPRQVVNDIVRWTQDETQRDAVALLLDQAGKGKTVVMRDVLLALEERGIPTLAIKADLQLSGITAYTELPTKLELPDSVERVIERLTKFSQVVVLIDQIDALSLSLARDQQALNIVLELVAKLRLLPNVHILLSCRTFDRNNDPRLERTEIRKEFLLTDLTEIEVREVLETAQINYDQLAPATQTLLRVPLHLDLFLRIAGQNGERAEQQMRESFTSLQALYTRLWQSIILKDDLKAPNPGTRALVLNLIVERMDRDQRTSVPQAMFTEPDTADLQPVVRWLASQSILIDSGSQWSLLHQTFFDFCYAKQFMERNGRLAETILQSDQGLFNRPKLIQVLTYLRGNNSPTYLREVFDLFHAPNLRFHLRDLLTRWFGALQDPTNEEWTLAQRLLRNQAIRPRLLMAMDGNSGWFVHLNDAPLQALLRSDDQTLDAEIIPYISSLFHVAQREIINLIRPYLGRNEQWNTRIGYIVLSNISRWNSPEVIDLFEEILPRVQSVPKHYGYDLAEFAAAHPQAGCRVFRLLLDYIISQYIAKRTHEAENPDENPIFPLSRFSLLNDLEVLNGSMFDEAIKVISHSEPRLFLETLLPWLERVVTLHPVPPDDWLFYRSDDLSDGWHDPAYVVQHDIIQGFISALTWLARTEPEEFRRIATNLAQLPYQTPQQLLAHVYRAVPDLYASDAFEFLIADERRLNLGDHQQYDSRQVIKEIYPFLTETQRIELEKYLIGHIPIPKYLGLEGLRRSRIEQFYLLLSIPEEYLTERGHRYLAELKRKFRDPDTKPSETPVKSVGGFMGPPIGAEAVKKMSDQAWLDAIQKYQQGVRHKDVLKGGARELSGILVGQIKEEPERFYNLLQQVPDDIDDSYVEAFINGLAEADATAEYVYDVIRRFARDHERDMLRTIGWALQKRAATGLPDDMMNLLEEIVRGPGHEDETHWQREERNPYNSYLNSGRGSVFGTLMRALDQQATDEARLRKWNLIEFVATDESTALRAGAVEHLLYMLGQDRERALRLFEQLMDGHNALLRSQYTLEFIYYAFYQHYLRMKPFILAAMNDTDAQVQRRGAELACIALISRKAMESPEAQREAQALADSTLTGQATWRQGAARIYIHNINTDATDVSVQRLHQLLNDEDDEVCRTISNGFRQLDERHILTLREFIEAYAASRSLSVQMREFARFLWKYGFVEPEWTLSVIEIILNNALFRTEQVQLSGGEELIRAILRVYTDPMVDNTLRGRAMDSFDRLMERFTRQAQIILWEWDRR